MNIKSQIPNYFTLGNLLCGLLIIISSFQQEFTMVIFYAAIALILDFFDGTVARLLKSNSAIGKELDSLADMVSFGAAPSLVLYNYWRFETQAEMFTDCFGQSILGCNFSVALILSLFAAYRLAKFNVTEQSTEYFMGVPTPMLSIAAFAIPMAAEQSLPLNTFLNSTGFMIAFVLIGGALMVSNIRLLSIKLGSKNLALNIIRIAMLTTCLVLIVWLKFFGVFLCLVVYLLFSLTVTKFLKHKINLNG